MTNSSYVFGSLNGNGLHRPERCARHLRQSLRISRRGTRRCTPTAPNTPVSMRERRQSLASIGGFANQQMVTAESVGANTSAFLTSISDVAAVQPCACESTQWGFWSAFNGAKNSERTARVRGSGRSAALGGAASRRRPAPFQQPAPPLTPATRSPISRTEAPVSRYLAAGAFSAVANFGTRTGAVTITGLDGTNYTGTATQVGSTSHVQRVAERR